MKTHISYLVIALLMINALSGQVKIGDNPQTLNPASVLELESTSRVLVITRVNDLQMNAINPLRGALVYNTDHDCLHYYNGVEWINICEALDNSFTVSTLAQYPFIENPNSSVKDSSIVVTRTEIDGVPNYNFEVNSYGISRDNIGPSAVTSSKIAGQAVGKEHIALGAVSPNRLESPPNPTSGDLIRWDGNGWDYANESTLSITEKDSIIGNEVVNATVGGSLVRSGGGTDISPYTLDVSDGGIGTIELADNAVTTLKILDANVTNAKLDKTNIPLSGFGAATANVPMGGFQINDLLDPALDSDAATKGYVDTAIGDINSLADGLIYVGDASGNAQEVAMNGDATMDSAGLITIEPDAITTGKILDASVTNDKLDKPGIPLSGFGAAAANVTMGGFQINDLLDPALDSDAATKGYVDTAIGDINSLADGLIYVGDALGNAQEVAMNGDATMGSAGLITIEPDAITTGKILDASVTNDKLDKPGIPLSGFGAAAANVTMGGFQINDLLDPALDSDAATKGYVDTAIGGINSLADGLIYVGDALGNAQEVAMNGDATMDSAGLITIEPDAITTGKILDASVTNDKLDKPGIPLSGFGAAAANVTMGGFQINDLLDPALDSDAATKGYVDTAIGGINSLADGLIYVGDALGNAQEVAMNGDATMGSAGLITIEPDAITTGKILDEEIVDADVSPSAAIQGTKISPDFGPLNVSTTGTVAAGNTTTGTLSTTSTLTVGGSFVAPIISQSTNFTLDDSHYTVILQTGVTLVTLPPSDASTIGRIYILKNRTGGIVNTSSNFIDSTGTSISTIDNVVVIQSDGAGNWEQIN